jgi:Bax protein
MFRKSIVIIVAMAFIAMLVRPFYIKPIYNGDIAAQPAKPSKKRVPEKPLHDVVLPDFSSITSVQKKKQAFFSFIRPAVKAQNQLILADREQLLAIAKLQNEGVILDETQLAFIDTLAKKYRINQKRFSKRKVVELLLKRVDIIPTPLVLVQAANESAWGTSRFARIGLNFFGIWCYQKGCGMVPRSRNEGADHEVQAFKSVDAAVKRYLHNINTNNAYQVFRTIRQQLRAQQLPLSSEVLATGLLAYSERGGDYITEITEMLRHNRRYLNIQTIPAAPVVPSSDKQEGT